ncbi:MAG: hypothetical protein MUF42_13890 [Cytophagaceae bacterium]|jgi:hypothetical protein|nr:hypothetical protein [Cytophagaceae bacterium]
MNFFFRNSIDLLEIKRELLRQRFKFRERVRILIVTDSIIDLGIGGTNEQIGNPGFGLSKVVQHLRSEEFYDWITLEIVGASREDMNDDLMPLRGFQFKNFEFKFNPGPDAAPYDLSRFDQVWLFGFWPGNILPNVTDASKDSLINQSDPYEYQYEHNNETRTVPYKFLPLSADETSAISRFMGEEHKGGVFATGDHHFVGSTLSNTIPRVRKMRKWKISDQVPTMSLSDRKDTNRPNRDRFANIIPDLAQSDDIPQPIKIPGHMHYYFDRTSHMVKVNYDVHPIFIDKNNEFIEVFPDHMHEGETRGKVFASENDWMGGLREDELTMEEFPMADPRPLPMVIAIGKPMNSVFHFKNQMMNTRTNTDAPFGLVSAYDGEPVSLGRIVTDSTWHHWFDVNLLFTEPMRIGQQTYLPNPKAEKDYTQIRNYHKNVAIWLTPRSKREKMFLSAVWNTLIKAFEEMKFTTSDTTWTAGIMGLKALQNEASKAWVSQWINDFLPDSFDHTQWNVDLPGFNKNESSERIGVPNAYSIDRTSLEIILIGEIFKSLTPLVEKYVLSDPFSRKKIDTEEIAIAACEGAKIGLEEFIRYTQKSLEQSQRFVKKFHIDWDPIKKSSSYVLPQEQKKLSLSVNKVILINPLFQLMVENDSSEIVFQLRCSGELVAEQNIKTRKTGALAWKHHLPSGYTVLQLDLELFNGLLQKGEYLELSVYLKSKSIASMLICTLLWSNDPSDWIGIHHAPAETYASKEAKGDVWVEIKEEKRAKKNKK